MAIVRAHTSQVFESFIVIEPDGQVTFQNLSADLLKVGLRLAPAHFSLSARLQKFRRYQRLHSQLKKD